MQRITHEQPWPLFDTALTRQIEHAAAAALPPHTLMQRAGLAVARLAMAIAPHARTVWIACGPGNNGGDGFETAMHLRQRGLDPVITWLGDEAGAPADALASFHRARESGVTLAHEPPVRAHLVIDALLGIGATRPLQGRAAQWRDAMARAGAPVLAVDLPSGLDADTGRGAAVRATHTLSLLTLKPGLFTGGGRDAAGEVWFDDLGVQSAPASCAWLTGAPAAAQRPHDSHKGRWGDVAILGGDQGMTGAALLAAAAALHGGAGRVFVGLLDGSGMSVDPSQPELMFRPAAGLDLSTMHVACGCGGGQAVAALLPRALSTSASLVLDADALNAIAADTSLAALLRARGARVDRPTVITPHPLEAARLLGGNTQEVQADRVRAAQQLADQYGCVVVLKGSGTVVAAKGVAPRLNPTGNAKLATAGTGDVLAGLVAARMAAGVTAFDAATAAAYDHGLTADQWPAGEALVASALARRLRH
ncbi:MAG TPA: NAD(P)H-hydrate dehydratase [Ramlibacter sp.]|nr:NAD(P)H-hydrate dehydratase [Ramlibacter sp.]